MYIYNNLLILNLEPTAPTEERRCDIPGKSKSHM